MLDSYCVKAQLKDGMDVLDLGCGMFWLFEYTHILMVCPSVLLGWGSLSLFLAQVSISNTLCVRVYSNAAQKYPNSRIVGLSNSQTQREYIMSRAKERGYDNLEVYKSK